MTTIEGNRLIANRLKAAAKRIQDLRDEIKDLRARLDLVEMHNEELQDLFDKLSADQAALDSAIASSIEDLDATFDDSGLNASENEEIAVAEDFGISSDDDGEDDFFGDDF